MEGLIVRARFINQIIKLLLNKKPQTGRLDPVTNKVIW